MKKFKVPRSLLVSGRVHVLATSLFSLLCVSAQADGTFSTWNDPALNQRLGAPMPCQTPLRDTLSGLLSFRRTWLNDVQAIQLNSSASVTDLILLDQWLSTSEAPYDGRVQALAAKEQAEGVALNDIGQRQAQSMNSMIGHLQHCIQFKNEPPALVQPVQPEVYYFATPGNQGFRSFDGAVGMMFQALNGVHPLEPGILFAASNGWWKGTGFSELAFTLFVKNPDIWRTSGVVRLVGEPMSEQNCQVTADKATHMGLTPSGSRLSTSPANVTIQCESLPNSQGRLNIVFAK